MTQEEFNEFLLKAETGDRDAQNKVAFAYGAGDPIAQNLTECFKWHLKAAEQGQLNSMMNLGGWCYLWGNGTEKNLERALYWMQKVMDAGANDDWSKNAYAVALNDRACELSDSMEKFQMFLKSAELGNMYGQNNVANAYANKKYGVEKDLTKAFEWYLKSAEQGNLNSMMNVGGWCYLLGKGTEYNFERALYWMQKVMDAGASDDWSKNAYAMANIGLAWDEWNFDEEGDGLDNTKTVELVNKAVSLGNPYGYAFMAVLYLLGNGVEKNILKAKEFADKVLASSKYDPKLLNPSFDETWGDWFNDGWLKTINKKYEQQKDAEQNVKEDTEHKENVEKMGSSFSMNNEGSAFAGITIVPMFERKRQEEEERLKTEEARRKAAEEEAMRKAGEDAQRKAAEAETKRKDSFDDMLDQLRKVKQNPKNAAYFDRIHRENVERQARNKAITEANRKAEAAAKEAAKEAEEARRELDKAQKKLDEARYKLREAEKEKDKAYDLAFSQCHNEIHLKLVAGYALEPKGEAEMYWLLTYETYKKEDLTCKKAEEIYKEALETHERAIEAHRKAENYEIQYCV